MYIDETISMDFLMPADMREWIDNTDKAFEENDDVTWDYYHELIGVIAKTEHAIGTITSEQMYAVWERYSTGG